MSGQNKISILIDYQGKLLVTMRANTFVGNSEIRSFTNAIRIAPFSPLVT